MPEETLLKGDRSIDGCLHYFWKGRETVTDGQGTDTLRRNHLTTWDAIAQSFGFLGPVMVVSFLTSFAAMGAGAAVPLAALLGGIACLTIAYIVSQYATRTAAAGSLYNYITKSLGPSAGFIGGWIYFVAVLLLTVAIIAGVGGWAAMLVKDVTGAEIPWVVFSFLEIALLFMLTYFDVRMSTRTQLTLAFLSVLLVLGFTLSIVLRGGAEGVTLAPFSPDTAPGGWGGVAFGLIYGILFYTGFESAASLGEETANPRQSIPKAIMGCVIAGTIFYVIVTFGMATGFGPSGAEKWAGDTTAMYTLAGQYGGPVVLFLITLAAIIDGFAVSVGCLNCSARIGFAMGRDGALPRFLGRSHSKYQTPYLANTFVLGLALAMAIIFTLAQGAEGWGAEFGYLSAVGALLVELIYGFIAIAALIYFPKLFKGEYNVFSHIIVPIIGLLAVLAAIYGSVQPNPDPFMATTPYVVLGFVVLGILLALYLRATQPGLVSRIGQRLVEDEASA